MPVDFRLNPPVTNTELNELFEAAWPNHAPRGFTESLTRALAYVCSYEGDALIGFVYAAWDGGVHAFLLDVTVHPSQQRRGVGAELVRHLVGACRERGIEWLHVDYEPHLAPFYERCGFRSTDAGLIRLTP
jgi:GNAT superfamily N-acetyltransferase